MLGSRTRNQAFIVFFGCWLFFIINAQTNTSEPMNRYQVIIIGAGMSGLSAFIKLTEAGFNNILIVEASNRVGGRINTISFQNTFIEMGAQWIHGQKGNPIYELSKQLHLIDDNEERDGLNVYASQDGSEVNESFVEMVNKRIENLFDNLDDEIENELEMDSDESIGNLLDEGFIKILKKLSTKNPSVDVELVKSIYRARLYEESVDCACEDLRRVSAVGWNEYETFDGDLFTRLKYGYGRLIDSFLSQIPPHALMLNRQCERILWSSNPSHCEVEVFNRLTGQRELLSSEYVITTTSLGYLKDHHHTMFHPQLPLSKIKAIENLGFGSVNKVLVVFDKPIRSPENEPIESLHILWRADQSMNISYSDKKFNLQGNKFYRALNNFEALQNAPNVFLCFTVGRDAVFLESLHEDCLIEVIHEIFSKTFPKLNLPKPSRVLHSRWHSDEFAKGSYSFVKTGSTVNDVKALAHPLADRVFFAGEGTTYRYIGTVHGAYISGRDAANKIIKLVNHN